MYVDRELDVKVRDKILHDLVITGNRKRALEMLHLNIDNSSREWDQSAAEIIDLLHSVVLATSVSKEESEDSMKIAAMRFISAGREDLGVEFFLLVGDYLRACRYLQNLGGWIESLIISKLNLECDEQSEIWTKYAAVLEENGHLLEASIFYANSTGIGKYSEDVERCLKCSNRTDLINLLKRGND